MITMCVRDENDVNVTQPEIPMGAVPSGSFRPTPMHTKPSWMASPFTVQRTCLPMSY